MLTHSSIDARALQLLAMPYEPDSPEWTIDWAGDALAEGRDSESLRMLAGLHPVFDREDVEPMFSAAVAELGLTTGRPPWEAYALLVVELLLAGTVSLGAGLDEAYRLDQYRYGEQLSRLASLSYMLDEVAHGHADGASLEVEILAEAARVRAALAPPALTGPFR